MELIPVSIAICEVPKCLVTGYRNSEYWNVNPVDMSLLSLSERTIFSMNKRTDFAFYNSQRLFTLSVNSQKPVLTALLP